MAKQVLNSAQHKMKIIQSDFTLAGSRFSSTSASYVDITNASMTYTSGNQAEYLVLTYSVMANASGTGNGEIRLLVNNVEMTPRLYIDPSSPWVRACAPVITTIPANTTYTLKLQAYIVSGSTISVTNEVSYWKPNICGYAIPQ